jgi:type I restriction enzyme M protein
LQDIIRSVAAITITDGDNFGQIYEYFLGNFALAEGQKGGEFYTPTTVVKLIVEVIEPYKTDARVFDPACGTGGMFVQSAKFIKNHTGKQNISVYGQEKVKETANLSKLNLFVNGLKGDVQNVSSSLSKSAYVGDYADTFGKFDYVMANPPFNVDGINVEDVGNHPLFATYGLPLSTSKSKKKKEEVFSNGNYLWVSLFANALNPTGRAGFVMANSTSDAKGGELEVRKNIIEAGLVDVMITIGSNFFSTVTLPVTLWFFDKAKTNPNHPNHDKTLFIDARKIFNQVSRSMREFTQAQIHNIAAIVYLFRGETENFLNLKKDYQNALYQWENNEITNHDTEQEKTYKGLQYHQREYQNAINAFGKIIRDGYENPSMSLFIPIEDKVIWQINVNALIGIHIQAQDNKKEYINDCYKIAEIALNDVEIKFKLNNKADFKKLDLKNLLKKIAIEKDDLLFVMERMDYFETQINWLDTRFPDAQWRDIEGLCKIASKNEIAEQQYSLNPGRYVGVAMEEDGMTTEDFEILMKNNTQRITTLHQKATELQTQIQNELENLFGK